MTELNASSDTDGLVEDLENDLYYFESDHLALKGNKDYSELLKTIVILEAQRVAAIKNYEKVVQLQKEALDDPMAIVDKLQRGEHLGIPDYINVSEIPNINWNKYENRIPDKCLELIDKKVEKSSIKNIIYEQPPRNTQRSHSQPWSAEEQKRLEDLLIKFPPEAVEIKRFKKIADALGNRTVTQVASRLQKYFIKLYKAGLPVPGRLPKKKEHLIAKRNAMHKHQRHNHYLYKPSTFFPDNIVPVTMPDLDVPGPSTSYDASQDTYNCNDIKHSSSSFQTGASEKNAGEYKLQLLQQVKTVKERENISESLARYCHIGYKCDYCSDDPIVGTRWHCDNCTHTSIDFCTDCLVSQMYSETCHHLDHKFSISPDETAEKCDSPNSSEESSDSSSDNDNADPSEMETASNKSTADENEYEEGSFAKDIEDGVNLETDGANVSESIIYDQDYFVQSDSCNYLDPNYFLNE